MAKKTNGYEVIIDKPELDISEAARQKIARAGFADKIVSYDQFSSRVQSVVRYAADNALEQQRQSVRKYLSAYHKKQG
jgi:hypothetical protein